MAKSNEPIVWSLFSAGGVVAALFFPITIVLTGIAAPAGWITEQALFDLVHHPLTRLYLFLLIFMGLFHGVHRTRLVLVEVGLKPVAGLVAWLCYGFATLGTILAAVWLAGL
jgi:fumarate reductase subunit D